MTEDGKEVYLGDGLYASFDGCQLCLRAPRENGDHVTYQESAAYIALRQYISRLYHHYTMLGHGAGFNAMFPT